MKNTYIALIVLLLVGMVLLFGFKGKDLEAPSEINKEVKTDLSDTGVSESEKLNSEENVTTETAKSISVKEFTVTGDNFSFTPNLITVKKGDKVKITFKNSVGFHDFVIDEFGAATKQTKAPTTEVVEFIADKVGSFQFYCSVGSHRAMGMFGTLKVE